MRASVVIVGAGISGLAVAYELLERAPELDLLCFDASERAGGNVHTELAEGYRCEWGPNGFQDDAAPTLALVRRLGLQEELVRADPSASIRWVQRGGRLRRLPSGPLAFLASDVLSWKAKARLLTEPLRSVPSAKEDESAHAFASRRLGEEAARVLMDAMVSGIHAGDARALSLSAAFPELARMERDHGSLFRGLRAKRAPRGALLSFRGGMQELTDALARKLRPVVRFGAGIRSVDDMGLRGFRVHLREGAPIDAAAVVLACPAWVAAELVAGMDPEMSRAMGAIPAAPVAVVHMGFEAAAIGERFPGFGFLAPRGEGLRILGTLFASRIFPDRAPAGKALFTTMVGGARDPEGAALPDDALLALVRSDLRSALGIEAPDVFRRVIRHERGIPQYALGHLARVATIEERSSAHPGLAVSGNSYRGISVNACVAEAPAIAERVLRSLGARAERS